MSSSRPAPAGTKTSGTSPRREAIPAPRNARRRITVHRVHPWSVLKLSLIFYFCMLLVVMAGLAMFWSIVIRVGVIQALQEEADKFGAAVQVNGGNLARLVFLIGLVNVVLWSAINVFMAFLYNLIADLVGGFRLTVSDDDPAR